MAVRVYPVQVAVPAGTLQAAPLVQPLTLEDNLLVSLEIVIPDGHAGLTGLAVLSGGTNVFPFTQGSFLTGNNERIEVPQNSECTEAGFTAVAFNTDIYQHSFWLRFYITDLDTVPAAAIVSPQSQTGGAAAQLAGIAVLSGAG